METLTPPTSPQPIIRESHIDENLSSIILDYSGSHSHNEKVRDILELKLDSDKDFEKLSSYCNYIISKKFKLAIYSNLVLPTHSDNKIFKLKIFQTSNHNDIINKILSTINKPNDKIQNFIETTVKLLLLNQVSHLERYITSIYEHNYFQIKFTSQYKNKIFYSNYYLVNIELLSVTFL